jgi:mono/diheme cytochrome c family protein
MRLIGRAAALGVLAGLALIVESFPQAPAKQAPGTKAIPELSRPAREGKAAFERHCIRCHGPDASGTTQGPPLVHRVYEPGHHGDEAFRLAIKRGTRAHHWRFGDMPPVPGITDPEIATVIHYIRELQRANGMK